MAVVDDVYEVLMCRTFPVYQRSPGLPDVAQWHHRSVLTCHLHKSCLAVAWVSRLGVCPSIAACLKDEGIKVFARVLGCSCSNIDRSRSTIHEIELVGQVLFVLYLIYCEGIVGIGIAFHHHAADEFVDLHLIEQ